MTIPTLLPIPKTQLAAAGAALEQLRQLVYTAATNPEGITPAGMQALRAAADHAGREAAARLGLHWEGEPVEPHDKLDWIQMLTYVADPF